MKSEIVSLSSSTPEYPCLRQYVGRKENVDKVAGADKFVVLFRDSGVGVIVHSAEPRRIGEYSDYWADDQFVTFNGTISLSNR